MIASNNKYKQKLKRFLFNTSLIFNQEILFNTLCVDDSIITLSSAGTSNEKQFFIKTSRLYIPFTEKGDLDIDKGLIIKIFLPEYSIITVKKEKYLNICENIQVVFEFDGKSLNLEKLYNIEDLLSSDIIAFKNKNTIYVNAKILAFTLLLLSRFNDLNETITFMKIFKKRFENLGYNNLVIESPEAYIKKYYPEYMHTKFGNIIPLPDIFIFDEYTAGLGVYKFNDFNKIDYVFLKKPVHALTDIHKVLNFFWSIFLSEKFLKPNIYSQQDREQIVANIYNAIYLDEIAKLFGLNYHRE